MIFTRFDEYITYMGLGVLDDLAQQALIILWKSNPIITDIQITFEIF